MTSAPSPKPGQLIPIIVGDTCRGFLYRRRDEFEVLNIDEKSVGIFSDEKSAIAAIFKSVAGAS